MALRIAQRLPRLAVVGVVLLLASATLAVGAAKRLTAVPKGSPAPVMAPTLVVPDVAGQAFVFAKGAPEDTGFAWGVRGGVHAHAPKEPLEEMPPPQRARLLSSWIAAHPKPTSARVRHFLFQHAWIVPGASFGWWHGAEALRELIAADQVAARRWGIGKKSELVARRALAEVEARTKCEDDCAACAS